MLYSYFKDTATVSRSTVSGNKTTYAPVGSFSCHIQPITDNYANGQMGRDGKDFRMFSTGSVQIGDRIVDQNSKKYEVTGVSLHSFRGKQHYQATLRGV